MRRAGAAIVAALAAIVILAQGFIGLGARLPIPGWDLDAPVADLAAVALILAVAAQVAARAATPVRPPAPWAWGAFLAVALAAALLADPEQSLQSQAASVHAWARKPLFCWIAYGVALPIALIGLPEGRVRQLLWLALGGTAALSLATSLGRIAAGDGLWWQAIGGITNNHKTLAVWMAPFVPWLWFHRARPAARAVGALVGLALLISFSKTAWLAALVGLAWAAHREGRPIIARWWAVAPALLLGYLALAGLPDALGSKSMLDAARSRDSLDLRAWEMFAARPLLGQGPGSAVTWELHEFPHYRINHVEAHGVVQKLASETGALGLLAWGVATALTGLAIWRRRGATTDESWAWAGVAACLHVNLLASTEAFTMTHWVPLGIAWAALHRSRS